jgi:hypothetical protein
MDATTLAAVSRTWVSVIAGCFDTEAISFEAGVICRARISVITAGSVEFSTAFTG